MAMKKKLIEVALPLEAINQESAREKSIRFGHPSTLHLWWARRPLATARAVIWSSIVDDPSSYPERFPDEESQKKERERLFAILTKLVKWENSNDDTVLAEAQAEILKSTGGSMPVLLDPFAGGGAIPLEAQRLGLEAHAHDLNPVAVMINKAMVEIPPRFSGFKPVNPDWRAKIGSAIAPRGCSGLAEDVKYYGEWIKQEALNKVGHLYPNVRLPQEHGGGNAPVISWLWARSVKCPNPACGCDMPLVRSFILSKKKGREAYVEPVLIGDSFAYRVHYGKTKDTGTVARSGARCPACGASVDFDYIRSEGREGRIGNHLLAVVADSKKGRLYISPDAEQIAAAKVDEPDDVPTSELPEKALSFRVQVYGMNQHKKLFTNRQLTTLSAFSALVQEAQALIEKDAVKAGIFDDHIPLEKGGTGARAYSEAVAVYLGFGVSRMTNIFNSLCRWESSREQSLTLFSRQAIPMVWDFAENNAFAGAAGDYSVSLGSIVRVLENFNQTTLGYARQFDAQSDNGLRNIVISTDPPYYDNIGYADLSDFFYVWLRQALKGIYPSLFRTMLVPKAEELIATPYRHDGNMEAARDFFEDGMYQTCCQIYKYAQEDVPVTIYYAFKQSESEDDGIVTKAARKMQQNEQLITQWAPALLNMQLDNLSCHTV